MIDQTIQNGMDLAEAIRRAPSGARIELGFGEFQGPFRLDKPITIVGQGEGTSLYGQGCPALIVLSKQVRVEKVSIADAYDPIDGVSVLMLDRMGPDLVNDTIYGRMVRMAPEQVIDLGLAQSKQQIHAFLEVEVTGPTDIKRSESCGRWLDIFPPRLETAGKHLIQFTLNAKDIGEEALILGSFELVTGANHQMFWITAQIVNALPKKPLANIALSVPKSYAVRFSGGFVIGKNKFPGQSAAAGLEEKQAFIYKDDGVWSIYQPFKVRTATQVNNIPMALGQRLILNEGDIIRAGSLELKVEAPAGAGDLSVNKPVIDLGTAPKTCFQLQFNGRSKEKLKILSTVPWLQVNPNEVELTRGGTKEIEVSLFALGQKPGRLNERGAILIQGERELLSLDANAEIAAAVVKPVSSGDLDFKTVTDWAPARAVVNITNQGTKEWKAKVKVDRDWLSLEQSEVTLAPGATVALGCKLNQKVEALQGSQEGTVLLDGDGTQLPIKARAVFNLPTIEPMLIMPIPALIDFKEVMEGQKTTPATLVLKNKGRKEWQPVVKVQAPWLSVSETSFTLAGGAQKSLLLQVTEQAPRGSHTIPVVIEGQGKQISLQARVNVVEPPPSTLEISATALDFGVFSDWKTAPARQIQVKNTGKLPWEGKIKNTIPWVLVFPLGDRVSIEPNSQAVLTFKLNQKITEGKHQINDGIVLEGPVGRCPISVQAEYQLPVVLALSAARVDFGEVEPGGKYGPQALKIKNTGGKDAAITVKVDPALTWLTAGPQTLSIPQGSEAQVEFRLAGLDEKSPAGVTTAPKAVQLIGPGFDQWIQVSYTIPELKLQLDPVDVTFRLVEGMELSAAAQTVKVTNVSRRSWQGSITSKDASVMVTPAQLKIEPGGSTSVVVTPTESVWSQGPGEKSLGRVVVFEKTSQALGVWVNIRKEDQPRLEMAPSQLDFGQADDETYQDQIQHLVLKSKRDWTAELTIAVGSWFDAEVKSLKGSANQPVTVYFRLNENFQSRKPGVYWGDLRILCGGKEYPVPVKVEKVLASWEIVGPQFVTFKSINRDEWDEVDPQALVVRNASSQPVDLTLQVAGEDWVEIPASVQLPAGESTSIQVCLKEGKGGFRRTGGNETMIEITGAGRRVQIPVRVSINPGKSMPVSQPRPAPEPVEPALESAPAEQAASQGPVSQGSGTQEPASPETGPVEAGQAPAAKEPPARGAVPAGTARSVKLSISTEQLTFEVGDRALDTLPAQTVRITNNTGTDVDVHVKVNAPWLQVEPDNEFLLPTGEWQDLRVAIRPGQALKSTGEPLAEQADAIQIGSMYGSFRIRAALKRAAGAAGQEVHPVDLINPPQPPENKLKPTNVNLPNGLQARFENGFTQTEGDAANRLEIFPARLDFECTEGCTRILTITNRGKTPLELTIQTPAWLQIQGAANLVCQPGATARVLIKLVKKTNLSPTGVDPRGIIVTSNNFETPVAVSIQNR